MKLNGRTASPVRNADSHTGASLKRTVSVISRNHAEPTKKSARSEEECKLTKLGKFNLQLHVIMMIVWKKCDLPMFLNIFSGKFLNYVNVKHLNSKTS